MKISKRIYLAIATLVFIGGGGTVMALTSGKPRTTEIKTVSTVVPSVDNLPRAKAGNDPTPATTMQSAQTTSQAASTITASNPVAQPTPDENKTKLMQDVTDYATSRGWSQSTTYAETTCFDRTITSSIGYESYDDLVNPDKFPLLQSYLTGKFMFDGATCKSMWMGQN